MPKNSKRTKNTVYNKRTKKNTNIKSTHKSFEQEIVIEFLQILNMIKLYHWKTDSYATHKATVELYSKLNENIDQFIEVLLGKSGGRINLGHIKTISLADFTSINELKRRLELFKNYLVDLNSNIALKDMSNFDLYNIRDEILGNINQFLYLLTFK